MPSLETETIAIRQNGVLHSSRDQIRTSHERIMQILFTQARDLTAALQIAAKLPQAQRGHIEVRRIRAAPSDRFQTLNRK